jgi:hypothetical protein
LVGSKRRGGPPGKRPYCSASGVSVAELTVSLIWLLPNVLSTAPEDAAVGAVAGHERAHRLRQRRPNLAESGSEDQSGDGALAFHALQLRVSRVGRGGRIASR